MIRLDVLGLEDLKKDFRRMDRGFKKEAKKEVRKGTNYLRNRVREATPIWSGLLKRKTKSSVRGFSGAVVIDGDAWYYLVVEYGSTVRGIEASLYSTKVLEREKPKVEKMIEDGILAVINR